MANFFNLSNNDFKSYDQQFDVGRIYMAEVMDTRSSAKDGSLKVWILNSGNRRDDKNSWVIAYQASVFYGTTVFDTGSGYAGSPTSFGWWMPMPYIGNYVFIFYPCTPGQNTKPYWFSCPYQANMTSMLPGIAGDLQDDTHSPKCENNLKSISSQKTMLNKVVYSPLDEALKKQGLNNDKYRGISTATPYRDTPSMCYGFTSPLGNQFVIDDGWSQQDKNITWETAQRDYDDKAGRELKEGSLYHDKIDWSSDIEGDAQYKRFHGGFRFRTRNGTQILILDSGDIYTINKDGTVWTEQTHDGYLDAYAEKGANIASKGAINIDTDGDINLSCRGKLSINAKGGISINSADSVGISAAELNVGCGSTFTSINTNSLVSRTINSKGAQLAGVFKGTLQGTAFFATNAGFIPVQQPEPVTIDPIIKIPVPTAETSVDEKGREKVNSISTRVPTHEPYVGHDMNKYIPNIRIGTQTIKETKETKTSTKVITNTI